MYELHTCDARQVLKETRRDNLSKECEHVDGAGAPAWRLLVGSHVGDSISCSLKVPSPRRVQVVGFGMYVSQSDVRVVLWQFGDGA